MGVRVLVVDDVVCSRHLIKRGLELAGHLVFDVNTAAEATAVLGRETIDLIVLDLLMPGKDGFETFNQAARASGVPIFAITSAIDETYIKKAVFYGFKEVLRKPLNFVHVNTLIDKHCTSTGARALKVQVRLPQATLDAAQAEATKTSAALEDFLGEILTKHFAPKPVPQETPATTEPVESETASTTA